MIDHKNLDPKDVCEKGVGYNKRLLGKAVLVVGEDTAVVETLVTQLAQRGADIILLCWHMSLETGRKLQNNVRSLGRRFLLIEPENEQMAEADQLMQTVQSEWGHVDVFIDMSHEKSDPSQSEVAPHSNKEKEEWISPNWPLVQAFLKEIPL